MVDTRRVDGKVFQTVFFGVFSTRRCQTLVSSSSLTDITLLWTVWPFRPLRPLAIVVCSNNISTSFAYSPGQFSRRQFSISSASSVHGGVRHWRVLVLWLTSHCCEQLDHEDHCDHSQLTSVITIHICVASSNILSDILVGLSWELTHSLGFVFQCRNAHCHATVRIQLQHYCTLFIICQHYNHETRD